MGVILQKEYLTRNLTSEILLAQKRNHHGILTINFKKFLITQKKKKKKINEIIYLKYFKNIVMLLFIVMKNGYNFLKFKYKYFISHPLLMNYMHLKFFLN